MAYARNDVMTSAKNVNHRKRDHDVQIEQWPKYGRFDALVFQHLRNLVQSRLWRSSGVEMLLRVSSKALGSRFFVICPHSAHILVTVQAMPWKTPNMYSSETPDFHIIKRDKTVSAHLLHRKYIPQHERFDTSFPTSQSNSAKVWNEKFSTYSKYLTISICRLVVLKVSNWAFYRFVACLRSNRCVVFLWAFSLLAVAMDESDWSKPCWSINCDRIHIWPGVLEPRCVIS
jgi:hypothetical protein